PHPQATTLKHTQQPHAYRGEAYAVVSGRNKKDLHLCLLSLHILRAEFILEYRRVFLAQFGALHWWVLPKLLASQVGEWCQPYPPRGYGCVHRRWPRQTRLNALRFSHESTQSSHQCRQ